jgi:hypothetical protein
MPIQRFKSKLWRIVEISEVLGKHVFRGLELEDEGRRQLKSPTKMVRQT